MPRDFSRTRRVAELIQRELAELLLREANDPRFAAVTVSGVDVSPDLAHAKVLVTLAEGTQIEPTVAALNRAAGYLRGRLGRHLRMRSLPDLRFAYDPTLDRATRVSHLIDEALAEDARHHDASPGATDGQDREPRQ